MTQSSGQTDATIWNKCWQHLESSYRYAGTSCQHTKTTWRNASTATHAVSKRALHPRSAAPSKLQSKMASANAAMPVPAFPFFLALPKCRMRGHEIDSFSTFLGRISCVPALFRYDRLAVQYLANRGNGK